MTDIEAPTKRHDQQREDQRQRAHSSADTLTERMQAGSRAAIKAILILIAVYFLALAVGLIPHGSAGSHGGDIHSDDAAAVVEHAAKYVPPAWSVFPFVALLLSIAVLPLISATEHWWHSNRNRFTVAAGLGIATLIYYGFFHPGGVANHFTHQSDVPAGWETVFAVFSNAIFSEFVPFIVLLFSLYVISGGINLSGDVPAHPGTNTLFLAAGTLLASFIGTTGAAMVLIRPLLNTNLERKYKTHTVIFFIFTVCNCGGLLLPIGDPPLFLGYLRGVPFTWTLSLWHYWLPVNLALLAIYFVWDTWAYRKEALRDLIRDEREIRPLRLTGASNFIFLLGVVFSVALIVPDQPFLGTSFTPPVFLRETVMMLLVVASLLFTDPAIRVRNRFDYFAITEVAALFCGIFICMQAPIEILNVKGASLGIDTPERFFWATGLLSSFLDNAPTYVVFFETAITLPNLPGAASVILGGGRTILELYLVPISLGAVFMGANTYIGNGPNFMVKSIAEQSGVKMPSFFGYMVYSLFILIPIFAVVALTL